MPPPTPNSIKFWAKTAPNGDPGISVRDHCLNVGCVAEEIITTLPACVRDLLPRGAGTLAALHDIGKITLGFQAKCPQWLDPGGLPKVLPGEMALSVTDHALVSQVFLQPLFNSPATRLWAVAVGAHHGKPKGKNARLPSITPEALKDWAEGNRQQVMDEICEVFGTLPTAPPDPSFAPHYSDLWLLAGLITVADWIGSNETWFPPDRGLPLEASSQQAKEAVRQIGWPGGRLRRTGFSAAFAYGWASFQPNPLQQAVADAAQTRSIVIVEGPMGSGKTEAALFAAQQLIASGQHRGIYFALPTQVTSNRIHKRIERFLRNTLADDAPLRLAHGNAWLEDDFDLLLSPSFKRREQKDGDDPDENIKVARSWFASAKQALLAPYGVGTIDQALQGVVAVKHFFVRRFALAGKVVILDEVHSYDIYTGTLITALIREMVNLRCSVIILSATLTAARRRELLAAAGAEETGSPCAYPLISAGPPGGLFPPAVAPEWPDRRRIVLRAGVIHESEAIPELIARAEAGQHVLWIRNTVAEAQDTFRVVCGSICEGSVRVGILHSRFPFQRRADLEEEWLERLGKNRPTDGPGSILIATQVVEQSVDIDLDFIVSDLAPTDMLLQRLGRLWRHERSHRHASAPEFWIRMPELPATPDATELKKAMGRSARVYAPYVLLRTMDVWQPKSAINLPGDIRPLLEATYAEPGPQEPKAWRELHAELEEEKKMLAGNAEAATRVLASPMLADKEEVLTRRKGAPTTPVVLLRSVTSGPNGLTSLTALDGSQVEVSEHEWRKSSAKLLHRWIVRTPRWMVPANAPQPRWLDLHGPHHATFAVVRDDGRCVFGEDISTVTYDPRLGIFAERAPQPTPQQWKDDDDEFDY